jgi:hypothetical protein
MLFIIVDVSSEILLHLEMQNVEILPARTAFPKRSQGLFRPQPEQPLIRLTN